MISPRWLGPTVAVLLVAACGDATPEAAEDWEADASGAAYTFQLHAHDGLREGPNDFELHVERLDGGALSASATVAVVVRMPAMVHAAGELAATRDEAEAFVIEDVMLTMPGTWELEITVEDGVVVDRASFAVNVP